MCRVPSHLVILQKSRTARLFLLQERGLVLLQDFSLHLFQQAGTAALVHVVRHPLFL